MRNKTRALEGIKGPEAKLLVPDSQLWEGLDGQQLLDVGPWEGLDPVAHGIMEANFQDSGGRTSQPILL